MHDPLRPPPEPADVTVLVVADVRLYRDGLVNVLAAAPRVRVAGSARDMVGALALARQARPQVVLFDVATPGMLAAAREVGRESGARLVAFAVQDTDRAVIACAEAGLAGYVGCGGTYDEVVAAVRGAALGDVRCAPEMAGALFRRVGALAADRDLASADTDGGGLTGREREVMTLLGQELSNKEIARALGIEVATVKNHVHRILHKLRVRRRGEVGARARWVSAPRATRAAAPALPPRTL